MRRILLLCLFIFNILFISAYNIELDVQASDNVQCQLNYDGSQLNKTIKLKTNKIKHYNLKVNEYVNFNCNTTLNYLIYNVFNNDDNLLYTETITNKDKFNYQLNISKVKLYVKHNNKCTVQTDNYQEIIEFNDDSNTEYEFLNIFYLKCDKNLTQSVLRISSDKEYNKYYKIFSDKEKVLYLDFNKEVVNYNNKIQILFQLYDRRDKFQCTVDSYGTQVVYSDTTEHSNSIIIIKDVYVDSQFKLGCNIEFKNIDLVVSDHYLNKQYNEFNYNNVSSIDLNIESFDINTYHTQNVLPKKTPEVLKDEVVTFKVEPIVPFELVEFHYLNDIVVPNNNSVKFWEKLLILLS